MFFPQLIGTLLISTASLLPASASAEPSPQSLGCNVDVAQAYQSTWLTSHFGTGETQHFSLYGDGDTDLDLFVWDAFGNLIASAESYDDVESLSVIAFRAQILYIEVRNLGSVWNEFAICVE
jgi:hypothetical protein